MTHTSAGYGASEDMIDDVRIYASDAVCLDSEVCERDVGLLYALGILPLPHHDVGTFHEESVARCASHCMVNVAACGKESGTHRCRFNFEMLVIQYRKGPTCMFNAWCEVVEPVRLVLAGNVELTSCLAKRRDLRRIWLNIIIMDECAMMQTTRIQSVCKVSM